MYCSKCGNQLNTKLIYCNICGAKTGKKAENAGETNLSPLNALIITLAFVTIGGLGILIGLAATLLNKGMTHEAIAIIAIAYLSALFAISFSLVRLISKLAGAGIKTTSNSTEGPEPLQISLPTNPRLNEYKQPVSSVTEHTTRNFDQVLVEKR